ncbi:protein AKNAD1 isoform X3 [Patagioenas fasciata]|uniref:protein AKNAD1 isoform X3 n=1 Tax=Patagioenas fasciata TaxID=372321 RepID=UPI003A995D2A
MVTLIHARITALPKNQRSHDMCVLCKLDMETVKKCKQSYWMKTQTSSSFSDELGCIPDATDEEQDDLPYDGDVGISCKYNNNSGNLSEYTCTKHISGILSLSCSEDNKNIKATASYETHLQPEEFFKHHRGATGTMGHSDAEPGSEASFMKELSACGFSKPDTKEHPGNSKMSSVLLRHFSMGELISTCQLIECETIPETSLTESINDTMHKPEPSEHVKGPLVHEQWATSFEKHHLEMHEEANAGDKNKNWLNENRCVSNKPISSTGKCGGRQENSQSVKEKEDTHIFPHMKEDRDLFKKTVSPHELKYCQSQAHYGLPDFSEVQNSSDSINAVPTTERAKSSPLSLHKSLVVNNILENKNYFNSAEVENQEEMSIPEVVQQLEVEDFSKHMTQETFFVQDNYLALNQLKRYLADLERNYLTAREEHHNLQLQNYKDKSINIGEFDPERKVEGEIFRLGMLLEDIQEQTDDSKSNLSSLLTSDESAHSSYSLCESSVVSSIADPPKRRATETAFLHENNEKDKSQTTDLILPTNQFALEGDKCNLCLHTLQKRAESTSRRETEPRGKGLLANKHSSDIMRLLSPEKKYTAEGLASHCQGALSQKFNADDENTNGNKDIEERKTGTCSPFIQRKPTDLSDTNMSSDSEDISTYDCYDDSQSKELVNRETESYKTFNTRFCGERKELRWRCPRGSRDQFKFGNYKERAQSCALCRNKSSASTSYSQKRTSTQKAQKSKQPRELVNRFSERQNFEAAKTCYSSTCDKIILSPQHLPSKKSAQSKSAINIRNRNANYFNANSLSATLDHAIQTANSLKKATERMVQAVSEDLAKVRRKQLKLSSFKCDVVL